MYHLRRLIRDREIDVDVGLRAVKSKTGEDLESLMHEALQSKCPEDGQNLLMYAAAQGNEAWFIHLAGDIRSKVSMGRHETMSGGSCTLGLALAFFRVDDPGEAPTRFPELHPHSSALTLTLTGRSTAAPLTYRHSSN